MLDTVFNLWIAAVGDQLLIGVMATIVLFELCLTIFEQVDML